MSTTDEVLARYGDAIKREEQELEQQRDEAGNALPKSRLKKLKRQIYMKYKKQLSEEALAARDKKEREREQDAKRVVLVEDPALPKAQPVRVRDVPSLVESAPRVELHGWCHRVRWDGKKLLFLVIRDGTGFIQCVLHSPETPPAFSEMADPPERYESTKLLTYCADALKLCRECAVMVRGTLRRDARTPYCGVEVSVDFWKLEGTSDSTIEELFRPDSSIDILLDWRHIMLRGQTASSVQTIRSAILNEFRLHFLERGVEEVSPPTIVNTFCESGGANLFKLDYYGKTAYMTQSSQLYLEAAVPAVGHCFCVLPSFRAEKSRTRRHLAEFTHLETEHPFIAFDDDPVFHRGLLGLIEDMICAVVGNVIAKHYGTLVDSYGTQQENANAEHGVNELVAKNGAEHVASLCSTLGFNLEELRGAHPSRLSTRIFPHTPFKRMRYGECLLWLKEHGVINDDTGEAYKWGEDVCEKDERFLVDTIGVPIMMTHFPSHLKSFYMSQPLLSNGRQPGVPGNSGVPGDERPVYNDNPTDIAAGADPHDPKAAVTESVDVLVPGVGEIVGGSMRIPDLEGITKAMEAVHIPLEPYKWYLDLRRFGGFPHGGCGIGVDRLTCWITGQDNIRKVTLFPRTAERISP